VLVTGAGRGIGLELVRQYAADGYDVIATCRDPDRATGDDSAATEGERSVESTHESATGVAGAAAIERLDVGSEQDLDTLVTKIGATPIDILICNAAVFGGNRSRFADVDWSAWRVALEVNLLGSMRVALGLWRNVAQSEERKIVFISSRAGLPREARPGSSYIYGSSKAALNSAARALALDLAAEGVIVAILNPGHVRTGIGGAQAPMTPTESVRLMRDRIRALTPADAGKFLHFDGSDLKL
jgi:NAD(P)-dependent dehydrogenase (short-subunit alcohol dehydrogenase family)